jgi:hypothetical protein
MGSCCPSLEGMATLLEERYVFADRGARVADSLRRDARGGVFTGIENPEALARALSARIRSLGDRAHLWVMIQPEPAESPAGEPGPEAKQAPASAHRRRSNFGSRRRRSCLAMWAIWTSGSSSTPTWGARPPSPP